MKRYCCSFIPNKPSSLSSLAADLFLRGDEAQCWSPRTVLVFWYHLHSHCFPCVPSFITYCLILFRETIKKEIIPQYTTSKPLNANVCMVSRNNDLINVRGQVCHDFGLVWFILFYFNNQMSHRQVSFHKSILSSHLTASTVRGKGRSSRMESCLEVYHLSSQKPRCWYLNNPLSLPKSPGSPCITDSNQTFPLHDLLHVIILLTHTMQSGF